ncbi:MAG: hypothetical protein ACJ8FT_05280 [Sphingomonas sp.]
MRGTIKGALALGAAWAAISTPAAATNSWGGYHWARTANPVTVQLGDNVDSRWDSYLVTAQSDWNQSTVIKSPLVAGSSTGRCKGVAGTIQVCNSNYGNNGWLGIASISITGGTHITQGTVKLNDTYFNSASYNTPAWRRLVSCQEIGHTYGLDHQDETFNNYNLGTCMDYTNAPSGGTVGGFNYGPSNEYPNAHDYDELNIIYSHLDSTTTVAFRANAAGAFGDPGDSPREWGRAIHFDAKGRPDMFQRVDGPGLMTLTHVFWALEAPAMR